MLETEALASGDLSILSLVVHEFQEGKGRQAQKHPMFCFVLFLFLKSHNYSPAKTHLYFNKSNDEKTRARREGSILPKEGLTYSRILNKS